MFIIKVRFLPKTDISNCAHDTFNHKIKNKFFKEVKNVKLLQRSKDLVIKKFNDFELKIRIIYKQNS